MAGFVKLAVAGAGKTTWLCNKFDISKRNIFISFTNKNVQNIKNKITQKYGTMPKETFVMTYTKFLYYWIIKPNETLLRVNKNRISSKGMTINAPVEFDRKQPHNGYVKDCFVEHYVDVNRLYFINRMSKLFFKQSAKVKKQIRHYIGRFIDCIYVDEFQDFTNFDYKLLLELVKGTSYNIIMVGDFYQSLVSNTNFNGNNANSPYANINYKDFIKQLESQNIDVDIKTLRKSYRCPSDTCDFVRKKLQIPIFSARNDKDVTVKKIDDVNFAHQIIMDSSIVKLIYNSKVSMSSQIVNVDKWGYSKGSTYDSVCVILTKSTQSLISKNGPNFLNKHKTVNTLYVALTRSRGITYLLSSELYKKAIQQN